MRGRVRAMAGGLLRGGPLRRELELESLDAIHFPMSVMIPLVSSPPAATTILDVQHEFLPENFPRSELAYRRYLYGASAPFLLYPASPWPHKNHARLLEAFTLVRRERPELRLVLTGSGHGVLPDGVESVGYVTQDELASLYRRASALVFPSLYEGFGQPPLEAMACGCPVACSDLPPLREVCGDAAVYFDPEDPEAIAAA